MRLPRRFWFVVPFILVLACQSGDGVPTEAEGERELDTQGFLFSEDAQQIFDAIARTFSRRYALGVHADFANVAVLLSRRPAQARDRARDLINDIFELHDRGRTIGPDAEQKVGELVVAIAEFAGLSSLDDIDGAPATACTPNVDCKLAATVQEELAVIEVPGSAIQQPFILYMIRLPDDFADPPFFPLFYEIGTIPAGITFPSTSPSGSLTLSQADDAPVAAVCALDGEEDPLGVPPNAVPGENLFLAHQENGVWVQLPYVPVTTLDCEDASSGIGATAGLWSSPIDMSLGPILDLLSPPSATAKGRGLGGAISSFSPFGALYTGTLPTETTISIVGDRTSFAAGETITFESTVRPAPAGEQGRVVFFASNPVHGPGAPVRPLVDGKASVSFVCDSDRIPPGSHAAEAVFLGTASHEKSTSPALQYDCAVGSPGE